MDLVNLAKEKNGDLFKIYEQILELNDNDMVKVRIFIDHELRKNKNKLIESEMLTKKGFEYKEMAANILATRNFTMAKNKAEAVAEKNPIETE
jgi:hypothetical protein